MSRPRFLVDLDFNENIVRGVLRLEPTVEFLKARELPADQRKDDVLLHLAAPRTNGLLFPTM